MQFIRFVNRGFKDYKPTIRILNGYKKSIEEPISATQKENKIIEELIMVRSDQLA
jgi:hypothetical protein